MSALPAARIQLWPLADRPGWATVSVVGCLHYPVGGAADVDVAAGPGSKSWRDAADWLSRTGHVPSRSTNAALYRAWIRRLVADAVDGDAA
jgi:hypothetical protein